METECSARFLPRIRSSLKTTSALTDLPRSIPVRFFYESIREVPALSTGYSTIPIWMDSVRSIPSFQQLPGGVPSPTFSMIQAPTPRVRRSVTPEALNEQDPRIPSDVRHD